VKEQNEAHINLMCLLHFEAQHNLQVVLSPAENATSLRFFRAKLEKFLIFRPRYFGELSTTKIFPSQISLQRTTNLPLRTIE
jgi:hypothetical protein